MTIIYIVRWLMTKKHAVVLNVLACAAVFALAVYSVSDDMFTTYDQTKAGLTAITLSLFWSGLFNSVGLYLNEQNYTASYFEKNLPVNAYLSGTLILQTVTCLIQSILCSTVFFYWYPDEGGIAGPVFDLIELDYGVLFFLILISADMLGLACGFCLSGVTSTLVVIPAALSTQLLLSGIMFAAPEKLSAVADFTTAKWGFAGLGSVVDLNGDRFPLSIQEYYPEVIKTGNELFDPSVRYILRCWGHLGLIAVLFFAVASIALLIRVNRKER